MKQILGRIQPVYKGEYDETKAYGALDRVISDGILYECLVDAPAGTSLADTYYWNSLFSKGSEGDKGDKGPAGADASDGASGDEGATGAKGPIPSHKWEGTTIFWNDEITGTNLQGPQGAQGAKGDTGAIITLSTDPANDTSQTDPASSYSMKVICDKADIAASIGLSDATDSQSSETIATSKAVKTALASAGDKGLYAGFICAFYGSFGGDGNRYPIPIGSTEPDTGWVLCDGTTTNGYAVPDLRNKFVRCAYKTDAHFTGRGVTGGSTTHTHKVTLSATTLTTSKMPSHSHTVYRKSPPFDSVSKKNKPNATSGNFTVEFGATRYTNNIGGSSSHTHSVSASASASNEPPYMYLAYIVKLPE